MKRSGVFDSQGWRLCTLICDLLGRAAQHVEAVEKLNPTLHREPESTREREAQDPDSPGRHSTGSRFLSALQGPTLNTQL